LRLEGASAIVGKGLFGIGLDNMYKLLCGLFLGLALVVGSSAAFAEGDDDGPTQIKKKHHAVRPPPAVVAHIDVSTQTLSLSVDGFPTAYWPVSTAGVGYHTPRGTFYVQRLARVWFSRKYDNSPMPNSVFFDGGIAIHGSYHIKSLGHPASHGCVRLHPDNAAKLFSLVEKYGASRTRIIVTD